VNRMLSVAAACGLTIVSTAWAQGSAYAPGGKADAVSDAEKPRRAAESVQAMRAALRQVTSKAEDARNEKDVVKLNCVNEKLAQMKGLLKVAEQSEAAIKEAAVRKDPSLNAEFAKVSIARSKTEGLQSDAQQCIGQLAYIVDEKTTVEVQQPAGQPDRETSGRLQPPPSATPPVVVRPRSASTFNSSGT
jgi:hypothetical protein